MKKPFAGELRLQLRLQKRKALTTRRDSGLSGLMLITDQDQECWPESCDRTSDRL